MSQNIKSLVPNLTTYAQEQTLDLFKKNENLNSIALCPPTPKKRKITHQKPVFSHELSLSKNQDIKFDTPSFIDLSKIYQVAEKKFNVIKQPERKNACGAGVLLMFYTDLLRQNKIAHEINQDFWLFALQSDYATTGFFLTKKIELWNPSFKPKLFVITLNQPNPKTLEVSENFPTHLTTFSHETSKEKALSLLKEKQETSDSSLIVSITHPELMGHWVLVDKIAELIYLRDPFSGKAYSPEKEEFFNSWHTEETITCVYLESIQDK